ncbi:PH domain-containing protein [Spongiactinospora sp. TRM90649]|uniref:PH domain-containing protein n=1 Tax=Spongiactinospora sp. TRM90649 TaxID=3031114 RepID=UPI0023F630FF|nr:PH domain-containing protein [Spongiactinospora sp. TRM90649]MDF5756837.1 PH domain-containing protein [Spongiactinospora sp. TRM90649]
MSEIVTPPSLPVTWRPRRGRLVAYGFAAAAIIGSVVLAIALPAPFGLADKAFMVILGCVFAGVLHLLGRCRVEADDRGVTLVNALRTHSYTWPEVLDVTLVDGEPWAKIDFADGSTVGAMGIQGSEKERARRQVAELTALIHERGEAGEP